jgi:hypothetical protein
MSAAKKSLWIIVVAALAVVCVVSGLALMSWQEGVTKAREQREKVEQLIAEGRGTEALAFIHQRNRAVKKQSEKLRQQWLALEVAALAQTADGPRLLAIYDHAPKVFENQEAAVLQLCRALLRVTDFDRFDKLCAEWRGRQSSPAPWFELEVDALLMRGKRDEAIKQLNARSFTGAADCGRLARLALVNVQSDPKAASHYLDLAVSADPRNPEVHLYRARMFEGARQWANARMEYQAAFLSNTNNPSFRDELADFHRRTGSYDLAVLTWANGLGQANATDSMWLRTLFWTKVARTIRFDWKTVEPPPGTLMPFVRYLLQLPPGTFWGEPAFAKLPARQFYEEQLQETFWLRLLAALKAGREDEALKLIESNRFRPRSWHLDLESALLRALNYRKTGEMKFTAGVSIALNEAPPKTRHQLLEQIDFLTKNPAQKVPADTDRLLRSEAAFAAIFLAAGWPEAALQLPHDEVIPDGFPEWMAFGFTQAHRVNRGNADALEFAAKQKPSPTLELLAAEILIADQRIGDAIIKLTPLAATDSEAGQQAGRVIAETYLRLKQYDQARKAIEAQPRLRQSTGGRELLARIAKAESGK